MGHDPLQGYKATNYSVLKPYGVWLIVSPFNFPAALTGGPAGAALGRRQHGGDQACLRYALDLAPAGGMFPRRRIAGWGVQLCDRPGGSTLGQALIDSPEVDGITFTGSYEVGMHIFRSFAQGPYVRPTILEMGGKNAAIVSKNADIEDAAIGIVRSAFGLQGQKCSACSRVFIEKSVYQPVLNRVVELTRKLAIGDPIIRENYLGPVVNKKAYEDYQAYIDEMTKENVRFLTGGKVLTDGEMGKGYFCAPTIVVDLPLEHRLWKHEMFSPHHHHHGREQPGRSHAIHQ